MSIEVTIAERSQIRYVLDNLRDADRLELEAADVDFAHLPDMIMRRRVFCFCAYGWNEGPVAIWGMTKQRHGVGAGFAFGTDNWGKALFAMLHQIREFVLPFLKWNGFHRVEAAALASRRDVARFMSIIGAHPEAVLRGYGKNGEDFISYRWLIDEYGGQKSAQGDQHVQH